jgi:hypothetical protein
MKKLSLDLRKLEVAATDRATVCGKNLIPVKNLVDHRNHDNRGSDKICEILRFLTFKFTNMKKITLVLLCLFCCTFMFGQTWEIIYYNDFENSNDVENLNLRTASDYEDWGVFTQTGQDYRDYLVKN